MGEQLASEVIAGADEDGRQVIEIGGFPSENEPALASEHHPGVASRCMGLLSQWGEDLVDVCLPPTCALCHGPIKSTTGISLEFSSRQQGEAIGGRELRWLTAWGWPVGMAEGLRVKDSPRRFLCDECLVILSGSKIRSGCWKCGRPLPVSEEMGHDSPESQRNCCQRCRASKDDQGALTEVIPLGRYSDVLREAVIAAKRSSCAPLAMVLGNLLGWKLRSTLPSTDFTAVTYIPSHWTRRLHRGGWPTRLIAGQVGELLRVPVRPLLKMVRRTKKQGMLDDKERRKNVLGAFAVRRGSVPRGGRILLVDDVWTTGSTLREAASALSQGYDATVCAAVVARAVGTHDG